MLLMSERSDASRLMTVTWRSIAELSHSSVEESDPRIRTAAIAARMAAEGISLESIVQRRPRGAQIGIDARPTPGAPTPVILITHETTEEAIRAALAAVEKDGNVSERPQMIRIEPL
jgi:hypothetical protein